MHQNGEASKLSIYNRKFQGKLSINNRNIAIFASKENSMNKSLLRQVIYEQKAKSIDLGIERYIDSNLLTCPEILVISGIRRCGKSILLQQIRNKQKEKDYYLSFDDERLINFKVEDFQVLSEVFMEDFGFQRHYYLDEVQNIVGWERFVSRLYGQGCKVFITGSNAHLLSRELGTFLTGRHVTMELYPFSFQEFLRLEGIEIKKEMFYTTEGRALILNKMHKYLKIGGFPQYIESENDNYLFSLYNDIIYKDVVVRNNISNEKQLKEMMYYLASNATHRFTYNSVAKAINIKSPDTIKSYIGFIEDTFLVRQLMKFDYSVGIQMRSPKKIYFVDNAFIHKIGFNATGNLGNSLENAVCVELMRRGKEIYYHADIHECDFIIRKGVTIVEAIQVTVSMKEMSTREREIRGVFSAMEKYNLSEGTIITLEEEEEIDITSNKQIHVIPIWIWLLLG